MVSGIYDCPHLRCVWLKQVYEDILYCMLCLLHTIPCSSAFVYLVVTLLSQAYGACVLPVVPEGYS